MAKLNQELRRLARKAAESELQELQTRSSNILRLFPDLRPSAGTAISSASSSFEPQQRKRRRMSAAARQAVSERMKKYWNERRKNSKKR